jgi:hypothetical protein
LRWQAVPAVRAAKTKGVGVAKKKASPKASPKAARKRKASPKPVPAPKTPAAKKASPKAIAPAASAAKSRFTPRKVISDVADLRAYLLKTRPLFDYVPTPHELVDFKQQMRLVHDVVFDEDHDLATLVWALSDAVAALHADRKSDEKEQLVWDAFEELTSYLDKEY